MNESYNFSIRVTGILIEDDGILVVKQKVNESRSWSGVITLPTNEFDENPIHDVRFIPIKDLTDYGFAEMFKRRVEQGFPGSGNYMGDKKNIGLGF